MNNKIDWSQYKEKNNPEEKVDWSQYKEKEQEPQKEPKENSFFEKLLDTAANNPITEAGISGGTSFINALKNMGNLSPFKIKDNGLNKLPTLEARNANSERLWEPTKRPFAEPEGMANQIGSLLGDILGAGTAFAAVPGSTSIPGALATGFSQGEGGYIQRLRDALIGLTVPGFLHGKEGAKKFIEARNLKNKISELEHATTTSERDIYQNKDKLAAAINKELEPVLSGKKDLNEALKNVSGSSESAAKIAIGSGLKNAEEAIVKKYNNLYEGFNNSSAGKTIVKDPIDIKSLESEFNLKPDDFSPDTQKLIENLVGSYKENAPSNIISSVTKKPVNEASISFEQAKPPEVSKYIDLWKQTRAEVADLRHSQRMASTPEAKRAFRVKADNLEKFSNSINERAMKSLTEADRAKYGKIQKGYLEERVPFLDKSLLKNATDKHPEIPDNFFEKLNTLGTPELINTLKKEFPQVADAITRHDIKGLSKLKPEKITELLNGDFGRFIPKEVHQSLHKLSAYKTAEQTLSKALNRVQTTEIGRTIRQNDIKQITKEFPNLKEPFKNVKDEQEKLRLLKQALEDQGYKHAQVKEALAKYKNAASIAKTTSGTIGSYLGIKSLNKKGQGDSDSNY